MHWQEIVLTIGQIIFTLSLLPSVFSKDKPALATSGITAFILFVFVFTYYSLNLYMTALGTLTTGILWFILAYQKYKKNKIT